MILKKFRKEIAIIALFLMFCWGTVFVINEIFINEEGNKTAEITTVDESHFSEGYIEVNVHVITADPISEHLIIELDFVPHGRVNEGDGLLAVPLEMQVSSTDNTDLTFAAGRRMYPVETKLDFYEGEVENYPFDEHRALLEILVTEGTSADGNWTSVPVKLGFLGHHHSYQFKDEPLPYSKHGYIGYDIHVKRSPLVLGTVIFWMATVWGLTIINIVLFVSVMMNKVKADFGLFGYMSGFIVALYFFRQMFPDIPPFLGVFADYLSLFWAILVAAGIANIVAIKWLIAVFKNEDGKPASIG